MAQSTKVSARAKRGWQVALGIAGCTIGACVTADMLDYWADRVLDGLRSVLEREGIVAADS